MGTILRDNIAQIRMATSHPIETPIEGDVDVDEDEAVKQILAEMEAEEPTFLGLNEFILRSRIDRRCSWPAGGRR